MCLIIIIEEMAMIYIFKKRDRGYVHPDTGVHRIGGKGQKCHDFNGNVYKRKRWSVLVSGNQSGNQRRQRRFLPSMLRSLNAKSKAMRRAG